VAAMAGSMEGGGARVGVVGQYRLYPRLLSDWTWTPWRRRSSSTAAGLDVSQVGAIVQSTI